MFKEFTEFGGIIQQSVFPLVVKVTNVLKPIGTGFIIGRDGLFVTAVHVLEEAANTGIRKQRPDGTYYNHYEFYGIYISNKPVAGSSSTLGGLVPINNIWAPEGIDIGFGWLNLPRNTEDNSLLKVYPVRLRPSIPNNGDEVCAVGVNGK